LWTLTLSLYTLKAGHWPLVTAGEFLLAFVWGITFAQVVLELASGGGGGGFPALLMAVVMALFARKTLLAGPVLLPPHFQSFWFQLHAATAAVAYGAFAVACGAALLQLREFAVTDSRFISRAVALGYPLLSLSMIAGAIWAQLTWGAYWTWEPKEIWALVVWLLYTLFFHVKAIPRWQGRPLALLVVIAFGAVLFTLLGTGWLARRVTLEMMYVY